MNPFLSFRYPVYLYLPFITSLGVHSGASCDKATGILLDLPSEAEKKSMAADTNYRD